MASVWGYRQELYKSQRLIKVLVPSSFFGGLLGSLLLVLAPKEFTPLIPWLLLAAATLFVVQPPINSYLKRRRLQQAEQPQSTSTGMVALMIAFQFGVGVYGGYFGAGAGILMLAALGFLGVANLHEANAVKTILASAINSIAVIVFIIGQKIHWPYALAMAVAAIAGGYLGARVARRLPVALVRWVVILIGFGLAGYYAWKQYSPAT
jgi:hypothetical protein